jgi:hypothetical protein
MEFFGSQLFYFVASPVVLLKAGFKVLFSWELMRRGNLLSA